MATKRTSLPTVNIRVADGKGKWELKPVEAPAVAGAWAVTPHTDKAGLFAVTDMETGMQVGFRPGPLALAKRAIEALAAHMDEETWRRLARVLLVGGHMSKSDRDLARSVQMLAKSFDPVLKVTVVVHEEDGHLVSASTGERIRPMTTKRCPRTVDLTPAQLARRCPQLFETMLAVPSSGPDALWYALQRQRRATSAKAA